MKLLIIGSGGREHALVWKLAQSAKVKHVYVAPGRDFHIPCFLTIVCFRRANYYCSTSTGNGGTGNDFKNVSNVNIGVGDFPALVEFAVKNAIDLVLPGPEAPLVDGIEAHFRKGVLCFVFSISRHSLTCIRYSRHPSIRS